MILTEAQRESFRRRFCEVAEAQFTGPVEREVNDCAALLRYAYRMALAGTGINPFFDTEQGRRHFADAKNLKFRNSLFVSRHERAALAGDLLFYVQIEQDQPYHAMIHLGPSARAVVYHTGAKPGEVRRLTIEELMRHPDPRWRPVQGNANFLGVHRWKILA